MEHKAELLMLEAQTKGGNQARAARHTPTQAPPLTPPTASTNLVAWVWVE